MEARLQAVAEAERELTLRERKFAHTTAEQQTERARLEQLEEVLVSRQETLDQRESNLHAEDDARLMHIKCIHERFIIILIFQSYLHHIRVIS